MGVAMLAPARAYAIEPEHRIFTPEMFGAKGDGITNDTAAMTALGRAVTANGGGVVRFRATTYLVGHQSKAVDPKAAYSFEPEPLLELRACSKPILIQGRGARLKCDSGLRYGIFEPDGAPRKHAMPYIGPGLASPYRAMILVEDCSGPIDISDIELDGSLGSLHIGGGYGDTGWQIVAHGLALVNNRASESVQNVYTHHHALDGLYIDGFDASTGVARRFSAVRSEYNGRQGCSIVGGRGYAFEDCTFSHTGRGGLASAPGAGVDIEAEAGKRIRQIAFANCTFANNTGCGLVADQGDSEGASFERCTFIGTTNWSAWPCKPEFAFRNCSFAGAVARAFGSTDARKAAQFFDCTFSDSSPSYESLYGGTNPDRPLADLSDAQNVLFSRCAFIATQQHVLPWSLYAIYDNCRMEQRSATLSYPRGTYRGVTVINGAAHLGGSPIVGRVILNGRALGA